MDSSAEAHAVYGIVVSYAARLSTSRAEIAPPQGWRDAGVYRPRAISMPHVALTWTDIRPLHLRGAAAGAR